MAGQVERAIGPYVHQTLLYYVLPGTVVLVGRLRVVAASRTGTDDPAVLRRAARCRAWAIAGSWPGTRATSASPGYARNLADGRVEVVARGGERRPGRLEQLLRRGPANAQVTGVEREDQVDDPHVPTRSFDIR